MVLEPHEKARLLRTGKPGLINPGVVSTHVRVDKGTFLILRLS
jgi:hypothetical protein